MTPTTPADWPPDDADLEAETIGPRRVAEKFHRERTRRPEESPYETAAAVLAWADDRREDRVEDSLVFSARVALNHFGVPEGIEVTSRAQQWLRGAALARDMAVGGYTENRAWRDFPAADRATLMAIGMIENERQRQLYADHEAGRLDLKALDQRDYEDLYYADRTYEPYIGCGCGWIPGAVAGFVIGLIVVALTGQTWPFLFILIGSAILGVVGTLGAWAWLANADRERLRLGEREGTVSGLLFLVTGPLIAVALSLVLALAALSS